MIAFHIGLGLNLYLGVFAVACILGWMPVLPKGFWDWAGKTIVGRAIAVIWHRIITLLAGIVRVAARAVPALAAPRPPRSAPRPFQFFAGALLVYAGYVHL